MTHFWLVVVRKLDAPDLTSLWFHPPKPPLWHTLTCTVSDILIHSLWLLSSRTRCWMFYECHVPLCSCSPPADDVNRDRGVFCQLHYPYGLFHCWLLGEGEPASTATTHTHTVTVTAGGGKVMLEEVDLKDLIWTVVFYLRDLNKELKMANKPFSSFSPDFSILFTEGY